MLVSASLILASCPPVAATPGPGATVAALSSTLHWRTCDKQYLCSSLSVPLDYSKLGGQHIKIALVELPSTSRHPLGDVVLNPGGPGASGVQFVEQSGFPAGLTSSFNIVGFDPRGVNLSDPVTCVGTAQERALAAVNGDPQTPAEVKTLVQDNKMFDNACLAHTSKALLEHVSTLDTVFDLDRIRAALGQPKLYYLGFSYGTYIGELYAENFPSHIKAMVLDGVINPALSVATETAQQADALEFNLHQFFAWCPTDKTCQSELPQGASTAYSQVGSMLASGHRLIAHLKPEFGGNEVVTSGLLQTAVLGSMYSKDLWPDLAQALAEALEGEGGLIVALAYFYLDVQNNGQFQNVDAANLAINCVDRPYPRNISFYQGLARSLAKADPDFGPLNAWGSLGCAFWPIAAQGKAGPLTIKGAPPILLIGSTGDPATPYVWAQEVAQQIPGSRLLTRDGPGHTGYLFSHCIQRWTNKYLETLALPPVGTVCAPGT